MKAFKLLTLLLILLTFSCQEDGKNKEKGKDTTQTGTAKEGEGGEEASEAAPNYKVIPKLDNIASFISGIQPASGEGISNYDTTQVWESFATKFDSIWDILDDNRLSKMKQWKKEELPAVTKNIKSLFYPFSGPDYLNADMFFSEADTFRLIGLEPIGALPDFSKMKKSDVKSYLNSVNGSLNDLFKKSYFITMNMLKDLGKNQANGTLPIICVFIKRTDHTITNIEYVGIDSLGKEETRVDSLPYKGTKGVKVEFLPKGAKKVKVLYYFKTDLSDAGLKINKSFTTYLNNMDTVVTYLKAASHLLHYGTFSTIRNIILTKSDAVLQDDSGISYKFFDKNIWNVKLYGNYRKAVKDFTGVNQPELRKAYESDSTILPLPFTLGYHWGSDEINLQLATKKK